MSVAFENVVHRYGGSGQGVAGVSLEVKAGELMAVIGASGCGKSTLLRLVAGLLPVQQGRLLIDGQDMDAVPAWQRSVGMVFQSYALFPHLDVLDNVAYGLRMRGVGTAERRRKARSMLETVGLADHAGRRPAQLSGGQQQRVALARALAFGPSVLLLDEPLAALDAHIRSQLCDEIRDVQRQSGAATLFVTHDQQEALMMADRVAVMHAGQLLQVDTPRELYARPSSVQVARFVGHANLLPGVVEAPGRVRSSLGVLALDTGAEPPGTRAHVLVRPEAIHPDPPADAVNRIPGRTVRVRYLGATCRYDFAPDAAAHATPEHAAPLGPLLCEGPSPAAQAVALQPESLRLLVDRGPSPAPSHAPARSPDQPGPPVARA